MSRRQYSYLAATPMMLLAGVMNLSEWYRDGGGYALAMGALLVLLSPGWIVAWRRDRKRADR